ATAVLHHEFGAHPLAELLRYQPRDHVGNAAGGERHHEGHVLRWPNLLGGARLRERANEESNHNSAARLTSIEHRKSFRRERNVYKLTTAPTRPASVFIRRGRGGVPPVCAPRATPRSAARPRRTTARTGPQGRSTRACR